VNQETLELWSPAPASVRRRLVALEAKGLRLMILQTSEPKRFDDTCGIAVVISQLERSWTGDLDMRRSSPCCTET